MNMWIKSITGLIIFSALCISIHAQKGFVIDKNGKPIKYDKIVSDSKGVLTVKKGRVGRKMNPSDYQYARIELPSSIRKAATDLKSKKYTSAASAFKKLYDKYKFVGWDVFCAFGAAQAYSAEKKNRDAINMLEKMGNDIPIDKAKVSYYLRGMKMLAELYAESGNQSKALSALKVLAQSNNDDLAAFSNNLKGDMLLKKGNQKDAKLMYMRTALLFDKSNRVERPEALFKTIKILRKEKNNKALEFEKMLKKDYPGSKYNQDL